MCLGNIGDFGTLTLSLNFSKLITILITKHLQNAPCLIFLGQARHVTAGYHSWQTRRMVLEP